VSPFSEEKRQGRVSSEAPSRLIARASAAESFAGSEPQSRPASDSSIFFFPPPPFRPARGRSPSGRIRIHGINQLGCEQGQNRPRELEPFPGKRGFNSLAFPFLPNDANCEVFCSMGPVIAGGGRSNCTYPPGPLIRPRVLLCFFSNWSKQGIPFLLATECDLTKKYRRAPTNTPWGEGVTRTEPAFSLARPCPVTVHRIGALFVIVSAHCLNVIVPKQIFPKIFLLRARHFR